MNAGADAADCSGSARRLQTVYVLGSVHTHTDTHTRTHMDVWMYLYLYLYLYICI